MRSTANLSMAGGLKTDMHEMWIYNIFRMAARLVVDRNQLDERQRVVILSNVGIAELSIYLTLGSSKIIHHSDTVV